MKRSAIRQRGVSPCRTPEYALRAPSGLREALGLWCRIHREKSVFGQASTLRRAPFDKLRVNGLSSVCGTKSIGAARAEPVEVRTERSLTCRTSLSTNALRQAPFDRLRANGRAHYMNSPFGLSLSKPGLAEALKTMPHPGGLRGSFRRPDAAQRNPAVTPRHAERRNTRCALLPAYAEIPARRPDEAQRNPAANVRLEARAPGEGLGQCAGIHVFEFAAHGHAVGDT